MRKIYITKLSFILFMMMATTLVTFGLERKKILCVGSSLTSIHETDQHLNDTISTWVDITYTDAATLNALPKTAFDTVDGVIFYESIGSNTVGNFGTIGFPVPCITMEAGVFRLDAEGADPLTYWNLFSADGGIWGYTSSEGISAVDLVWKITDAGHDIVKPLEFKLDDTIRWSAYPTPGDYGIPYIHDLDVTVNIIATAARTEGGSVNTTYDQTKAIAFAELPKKKIIYMNAARDFLIKGNATDNFYKILEQTIYYIFDCYPISIDQVKKETFNLSTYPNPAVNSMHISFKAHSNLNAQISLVNLAGQTVYSKSLLTEAGLTHTDINVDNIPGGIYLLQLEVNNQMTNTKVVIK